MELSDIHTFATIPDWWGFRTLVEFGDSNGPPTPSTLGCFERSWSLATEEKGVKDVPPMAFRTLVEFGDDLKRAPENVCKLFRTFMEFSHAIHRRVFWEKEGFELSWSLLIATFRGCHAHIPDHHVSNRTLVEFSDWRSTSSRRRTASFELSWSLATPPSRRVRSHREASSSQGV